MSEPPKNQLKLWYRLLLHHPYRALERVRVRLLFVLLLLPLKDVVEVVVAVVFMAMQPNYGKL